MSGFVTIEHFRRRTAPKLQAAGQSQSFEGSHKAPNLRFALGVRPKADRPTAPEPKRSREKLNSLMKTKIVNDPSAGSPTETLLRLLLPLNAQVWESFRATLETRGPQRLSPNTSLKRSIGSSDGRCVQRAGTESTQAYDLRLLGIPGSRRTIASSDPNHEGGSAGYPFLSERENTLIPSV